MGSKSLSRIVCALVGMALILSAAASAADDWSNAPKVNIILSNITSDNGKDAGKLFKKTLEERTGGTVTVELFEDNVLGDDLTVSQMTMQGDIGICVTAMSPLASMYADFYAFDAPFMFIDKQDAYKKLDGPVGQAILDGLTAINLKGLTFWESGFRHLTNNKSTGEVPEKIKNFKIRVMPNEVHIASWKAWGANPTPMSFAELFTALQQGTVDGEECPLGVIYGNKFHEVQKYLTLTGHSYTPFITFMNLQLWESLNERQQEILIQCMREATDYERERSTYYEQIILDNMRKYGTIITEPNAEQKQVWKKMVLDAGVYDIIKKQMAHPEYLDELVK